MAQRWSAQIMHREKESFGTEWLLNYLFHTRVVAFMLDVHWHACLEILLMQVCTKRIKRSVIFPYGENSIEVANNWYAKEEQWLPHY